MSPELLTWFAALIEKETGIIYGDSNSYQLQGRIDDFCRDHRIANALELQKTLGGVAPGSLRQNFIDVATNNETSFFRDPVYFSVMVQYLVNEVLPYKPLAIRIWSAAASTGQEAISMAIALDELSGKVSLPPWSIVATDISGRALDRIRAGVYSDFEIARGISPERKAKYFVPAGNSWKIRQDLHSRIECASNNLLCNRMVGPFDLVFLRNVLIYQKIEGRSKILKQVLNQLGPKGALVLGVGETLFGVSEEIQSTFYGGVVLYQKNNQTKVA